MIEVFFRKCRQLIIFGEKVQGPRPKSVSAVEMAIYVHWTCLKNGKDVHA